MSRVKLSQFLGKVNYDKCLLSDANNPQVLLNQFSTNVKQRNSVQNQCDNYSKRKNTSIFRDIADSVKRIEKLKIAEEGDILTNKLEGTTSLTRKAEEENSGGAANGGENMDDDIDQEGGGRSHRRGVKRKYKHHKKSTHSVKRRKTTHKKTTRKKRKSHKKRNHRRSATGGRKKRKSGKTRRRRRKHHFKRHNIFSQAE
jgi:hypothetical protein